MRKFIFSTIGILGISLLFSGTVFAQDNHTAREEAEGKIVWEKLQAKQAQCLDLSDDDFGVLGEYFMGQMTGASHEAMNNMMIQMMGENGEEQMHIAMGKRMSGCEPEAPMPQNMMMGGGMMGGWPARQSIGDGGSSPVRSNQLNSERVPNASAGPYGRGNSMMNFGFTPFGGFGWIFMILWWALIIAGIIALIRWLASQSHETHDHDKSPIEILKERYAKGEIDKKEFMDKKKDLV